MPYVIVTDAAIRGIERCRTFLAGRAPAATHRAAQAIARHFQLLETNPEIGHPQGGTPIFRELVIPFGDSGYVALYHHDPATDAIYILAFRH